MCVEIMIETRGSMSEIPLDSLNHRLHSEELSSLCVAKGGREGTHTLVSVIIPNYNDRTFIDGCIRAVYEGDYENIEVILVDTGSENDDYSYLEQKHPELRVIRLKERTGFAKACNIGMAQAEGDYYFLLNNDTLIAEDCLRHLVSAFQRDPDLGIAGALCPSLHLHDAGFSMSWPEEQVYCLLICGAGMLISRACVEAIGPLEETFFFYREDDEYVWRASLAGIRIASVPKALVFHHRGGGGCQHNFQKTRNMIYWHIKLLDGFPLVRALCGDVIVQTLGRMARWPRDSGRILYAWGWIIVHMKEILAKRRAFRRIRRVRSRNIAALDRAAWPYVRAYRATAKQWRRT